MDDASRRIEQQVTVLLRRGQRIHLVTSTGGMELERSAYGIMCRLADDGPQRLGALAQTFGLDPSTITRQVRALEEAGLAARTTDETDRRAAILDLTGDGRDVLDRTRTYRRQRLQEVTGEWSDEEREEFARLLEKFNTAVSQLSGRG